MMPQVRFLAWTTAGSLLWILILTMAGQALGEGYQKVGVWIGDISAVIKPILVIAVLAVVIWVVLNLVRSGGRSRSDQ
ncbi:MAG: DedA family protein, partial [Cyanobacteriota bacterium]|nr:DedA family protein [Cyanobacteriota bacterium]